MQALLKSMLLRIVEGTLLPTHYFAGMNCDAALDARDRDDEFDLAWVRVCNQIDRLCEAAPIEPEAQGVAEEIRREGFLAVSRATGGHEIASYVSDDLDLIARGWLLGLDDSFLNRLWRDYDQGKFPAPPY